MIKFGPSGNSEKFFDAGLSKSEESAVWVKNMGLDCFEYSFGRGVRMADDSALRIGAAFRNKRSRAVLRQFRKSRRRGCGKVLRLRSRLR